MKSLVTILAVAFAVAFTVPAFAGPGSTITNKEDCEKAGKVWDDAGKKMRGEAVSDGRRLPAPSALCNQCPNCALRS